MSNAMKKNVNCFILFVFPLRKLKSNVSWGDFLSSIFLLVLSEVCTFRITDAENVKENSHVGSVGLGFVGFPSCGSFRHVLVTQELFRHCMNNEERRKTYYEIDTITKDLHKILL